MTATDVKKLDAAQTKAMILYAGEKIRENKPLLTKVDSAIGDGDHGIGMSVGFEKVEENLKDQEFTTINDIFKKTGMSMVQSMGGASGVIFGTMFLGGVKDLDSKSELDVPVLSEIFSASLDAIKQRGKASLGDKTMIDALEPAVNGLKESVTDSATLLEALKKAEENAADGVEKSKNYIAKFGRAKSLGERALGNQDAGATSVWIIFKSMREWVEQLNK
ncbi:dihydroxyacetone kinase subunit L [Oceanobacillus oncorhynchi subsp. incaldanensis]|uniref:phosphoenolpyruvate--glycerone phosphotransferase n=1 Tax=Oceanobacillus oncorhynchi TaxID=545501 RepID=A0A0A1M8Q0_9BACI|nr:dihydroxyacetone kinase subunit DhaL [Oceanobacillus oncorhynchi]GIO20744.1 dihydroxyacetone kinase subunit L [Oceanobacillus oncorhynchi subsp. incaldanensis]CEI81705.1 PTS-dependent dihydroxyacetone kinase, ADP-binding subunit DhaL [Oceanobacillus oncorhynchi]